MVKKALFVCLGNTCRSPIAEAVFRRFLKERGIFDQWIVDSAGLADWHVGNPPNSKTLFIFKKYNISYNGRSRQIEKSDLMTFDYIFGMDEYNIYELTRLLPPDSKAQILLLGDFDPQGDRIIEDPYCDQTLLLTEKCYQQCLRSCEGFLNQCK